MLILKNFSSSVKDPKKAGVDGSIPSQTMARPTHYVPPSTWACRYDRVLTGRGECRHTDWPRRTAIRRAIAGRAKWFPVSSCYLRAVRSSPLLLRGTLTKTSLATFWHSFRRQLEGWGPLLTGWSPSARSYTTSARSKTTRAAWDNRRRPMTGSLFREVQLPTQRPRQTTAH